MDGTGGRSAWKTLLAFAGAAFALAHLYQGARGAAWAMMCGLAAGLVTLWADNLWPAIALHADWKLVSGGALFAVYRGRRLCAHTQRANPGALP